MRLIRNENSDLLNKCLPLNQSLFEDVFNNKMWDWYYEWGLTDTHRRRKYLYVKDQEMFFDEDVVKKNIEKKGIWKNIKRSARFASAASKSLRDYKPEKIDDIYEKEMLQDYNKMHKAAGKDFMLDKIAHIWGLLVDNFKYAMLANLIIQYNYKNIPEIYAEDLTAKRINALVKLGRGDITKEEFDKSFGFLAESDYDFSCKRYYELKKIPLIANHELEPKEGVHNFRDHVKFRNIKLIALLRRLFLSLHDKDVFYKTKEEVLAGKEVDVSDRKKDSKKTSKKAKSNISRKTDVELINGTTICGRGIVEGNIFLVDDINDLSGAKKGCVVITKSLHPNLASLLPICQAIISEKGGKLSHLAIVAQERDIPIISEAENACEILRPYERVKILVNQGVIVVLR